MVHHGQRLPLGLEAGDDRARVHAELDDFQRDAAPNGFLLVGQVHHAAAAFPDFLEQLVTVNVVAGRFGERGIGGGFRRVAGRGGKAEFKQAFGAMAERGVRLNVHTTSPAFFQVGHKSFIFPATSYKSERAKVSPHKRTE